MTAPPRSPDRLSSDRCGNAVSSRNPPKRSGRTVSMYRLNTVGIPVLPRNAGSQQAEGAGGCQKEFRPIPRPSFLPGNLLLRPRRIFRKLTTNVDGSVFLCMNHFSAVRIQAVIMRNCRIFDLFVLRSLPQITLYSAHQIIPRNRHSIGNLG